MAFGALGGSASSAAVPAQAAPAPSPSLGCLRPSFSQPNDGGAGGGSGAGRDDGEDAGAQPKATMAANNQVGAKQIHSSDNKNDDIQQLKLDLTEVRRSNASIEKGVGTLVHYVVTGTTENKDAENRMKGLLGSMFYIADKLPMFCGGVFVLLSNLSAANSPAPKAGQNFDDPWMQVIIMGSLILCFVSVFLISLASKFKDSESIDGVLFELYMWLLLLVFLTFFLGLCVILHFLAHISKFILWPIGILFMILSVLYWYLEFYKERKQILEERKKNRVLANGMSPENLEDEATLAQGEEWANSYTV